jgi:hypothetical protein
MAAVNMTRSKLTGWNLEALKPTISIKGNSEVGVMKIYTIHSRYFMLVYLSKDKSVSLNTLYYVLEVDESLNILAISPPYDSAPVDIRGDDVGLEFTIRNELTVEDKEMIRLEILRYYTPAEASEIDPDYEFDEGHSTIGDDGFIPEYLNITDVVIDVVEKY